MGSILATVTPDNTPGGAVLTFALPLGLFVVVAAALYLLFSRPHRRIPAAQAPVHTSATAAIADPETARGAAIAAGLPTAAGGGGAESQVEPAGGVRAAGTGPSNVTGQDGDPAGAEDSEPGMTDGRKASE